MTHFGRRLADLMVHEGYSSAKIDGMSQISKQKLSSYLKSEGASSPNFESIDEIAKFFEISPGYFFSKKISVPRYKKLKRLKKLITHLTTLEDDEIVVFERFFEAHADKKAVEENKALELEF